MRWWVAVLGLAGVLAAASLASAQTDASPAAPQAAPPAAPAPGHVNLTDPVLAFYPAAARAAGVEGQAVIHCKRDEHLALTGCALVSEDPAGQGFGAAALAMAAKSAPNPRLLLKDAAAEPAADTTIKFTLRPPFITPDVTRMAHIVKSASIVSKPTNAQVQAAYPPRALDNQIQGGAVIECVVMTTGKLAECHVYDEQPTGYGFGQAALDLAGDFVLKPRLIDGEAVGGAPVRIGVAFSSNDPAAPLSLPAAPPPGDAGAASPP
jgi:hypothetical protein